MRTIVFLSLTWLLPQLGLTQDDPIKKILTEGVALFEQGKYKEAIAEYEKVFELDKDNPAALFEIGYAHYALKDYDKAIKYVDKVLKAGKEHLLEAYNLKGNVLDDMGKSDKAIKVYQEGLEKFPDEYLLHFNLGISHYRVREYEAAASELEKTISIKLNHKSSHYYLGKLNAETGQRVPSILAHYFFLLLEPEGERAQYAYDLLRKQIGQGVEKNESGGSQINLSLDQLDGEFSTVDMMLGLLVVTSDEMPLEDKSDEAIFAYITDMIFGILGENKKDHQGLYWDLYADLFSNMKEAGHTQTFCYYISQSRSEKAAKWVAEHAEQVDAFFKWINE